MIMRILDKVIRQTRDLLQLLESIAEKHDRQQHTEKESPHWPTQCINCDESLVGSRQTSIAEELCDRCWDNCHPMHPQPYAERPREWVRLDNI